MRVFSRLYLSTEIKTELVFLWLRANQCDVQLRLI